MTSPGEPRATSGQAGGFQARANWSGGMQGGAAGPGAGRTLRRWRSAPARAVRRWLCVASAPGTGDSQPLAPAPRARSLAPPPPPPPRRPNPPARTDPRGREPACLALGGTEDGAGGGDARDPENSAHSHPMRPGEPAPTLQQPRAPRWAVATQRARRGRSELGVTGAREKLKPAHFQPPSSLFLPSLMPSSHSRVMSLTPRGRPRMCPSSP